MSKKHSNIHARKKCLQKDTHHTIKTFTNLTSKDTDVEKSKHEIVLKFNLDERKTSAPNNIIKSEVEKGRVMAIHDVKHNIKETKCQINNNWYWYKKSKQLKEKVADGLKIEILRTIKLYPSPKIHKRDSRRPEESSINNPTSKIPEFVDFHVQPIAKEFLSYIWDTNDFFKKIKTISHVLDKSFVVTIDVRSLYMDIPNSEGIAAVWAINKRTEKTLLAKIITTFPASILPLTNFVFSCLKIYKWKVVQWEILTHCPTQILLWLHLEKNMNIYT